MLNIFKKMEEIKAEKERQKQIKIEEEKKRNRQFLIRWASIMVFLVFLLYLNNLFFESHPQTDDTGVMDISSQDQNTDVEPSINFESEQKKILTDMMTKKIVYRDKSIKYWDEYETVRFGNYNTDGNNENGNEPIEWYVLERDNNEILLFSKYVIDLYFNSNNFIDVAFNEAEKELINIDKYNKNNSISIEQIHIYFNSDNMYGDNGENNRLATNVLGNIINNSYYKNEPQSAIRDNMKFVLRQSIKNTNSDRFNVCNMYGQYKNKTSITDDGFYTVKFSANSDYKDYSIGFRPILTIVNKYNIPEQNKKDVGSSIKQTKKEIERPVLDLCYLLSKEDKVFKWDAIDFTHGLKFTSLAKLEPASIGYIMKLTNIQCSKISGSLLEGWTSDGKQYYIKSDGKVRTVYCLEDGKVITYEVITADYGKDKVYEYLRRLTNDELAKFIGKYEK